jgi:hypothetical protein
MPNLSNYLENALINAVLRNTAYTSPTTVYLSLHTGDPAETGANEVTGAGYARQACAWNAAANGATRNTNAITFPAAAGLASTGTITTIAGSLLVDDTDNFILDDGVNAAVTFEFDDDGSVVQTDTLRAVTFTSGDTADQVRDAIITAVTNAPTLDITAANGGAALVNLTNDTVGTQGDVAIVENVTDVGFLVTGMSGGEDGWGIVTYLGVWDAVSGGNFLFQGEPIVNSGGYATVDLGDTYSIPAGTLQISMYTGGLTLESWGASSENGPDISLPRYHGRLEVSLANALLNAVLRNTTYTSPATVYLGIWAGTDFRHVAWAPFAEDGIEEIGATLSVPSYARQACAFDAPTDGVTQNTSALTFGPDSLLWQRTGDYLYFVALYDASTGGNLLMVSGCTGPTFAQKLAGTNQDVEYAAGSITVSFD